jgi:hypothetical protein
VGVYYANNAGSVSKGDNPKTSQIDIFSVDIADETIPDDTMAPTGAVHASDNVIWSPDDTYVSVLLNGYVVDELSIARDGEGIGVSGAHIVAGTDPETTIILKDESTNLLGSVGSFSVSVDVPAVKDAVYYASQSDIGKGH